MCTFVAFHKFFPTWGVIKPIFGFGMLPPIYFFFVLVQAMKDDNGSHGRHINTLPLGEASL